jgi:threonine aldolase
MIPLASDTETKPTEAMRRAMAAAEVGDEQKGEDPTVNRLLERVCDLLGKEAALFLPGGTMCNLVALKTHTQPGDAVLADHMAHILRAESGGSPFASGVLIEPVFSDRGIFTPGALEEAYNKVRTAPWPYAPTPRLVCVEQTHNFGGGTVWRLDELRAVHDKARELGLALHMDGARLLNAVVASGVPAREFAACVDSVWIDFTKGLGAPVGAVLAGPADFIARARLYKHMFGGAMRQAGIVAAGCLHALDHHVERLAQDHENARRLARGLSKIPGIRVLTPEPETNMVFFEIPGLALDVPAFTAEAKRRGVSLVGIGSGIRAVTHLDVSGEDIDRAVAVIAQIAGKGA